MSSLGTGFVPIRKNKIRHFDKDTFLTLGNGDKLLKDNHHQHTSNDQDDELLSEFISILTTLTFYTDPSESNKVLFLTKNQQFYSSLFCELFPDYYFTFASDQKISIDHDNGIWIKSRKEQEKEIIFVDNILKYKHEIEQWDPYLMMGVFKPRENVSFLDGILLRPVMGDKCRLLVKGIAYRNWNRKNLDRLVNYHLYKVKQNYRFYDPVTGDEDISYDLATYRYILSEYLSKVNLPNGDMDNIDGLIKEKLN
jgi:hypothetical protein